jgi:hypothetical protein
MAANEGTSYANFSNVSIGTASGGGGLKKKGVLQSGGEAETITGATTLTNQSKRIQILDGTVGAAVTLPALADGLEFVFYVGTTFITSNWVLTSAEGDNINGYIHNIVDGAIVAGAEDQINLIATAESVGDWYRFVADSGNSQWLVSGQSALTGATTATDPA